MSFSALQIEELTQELRNKLGDNITWRFEERFNVMLSEFAQNKSANVLNLLRELFPHEWDRKTAKHLPEQLQEQLQDLAKITNEQKLLATPASNKMPAMVAFWWPWGHGGTYSLRIKLLSESYQYVQPVPEHGLIAKLKNLFS